MAITKITVPLDGSSLGEAVLPYAIDLAKRLNASIDFITVVKTRKGVPVRYGVVGGKDAESQPPQILDRRRTPSDMSADTTRVKGYLEAIAARLQAQGLKASHAIVAGTAAESIIEHCSDSDTSLIAMATHGWTGMGHEGLGSVTEAVLDGAQIPVLVVRPLSDVPVAGDLAHISTLIVGLNGSGRVESSLNLAGPLADQLGAKLIVERSSGAAFRFATPEAIAQAEEEHRSYIAGIVSRFRAAGKDVMGVVKSGAAAADLLELAEGANNPLIVLTSQARSGRSRWLMGSVTDSVVRTGATPVLVIPVAE